MSKRPPERDPNTIISSPEGKRRDSEIPIRTSDRVRGINENLVQQGTSKLGSTSGPVVLQSTLEPFLTNNLEHTICSDETKTT